MNVCPIYNLKLTVSNRQSEHLEAACVAPFCTTRWLQEMWMVVGVPELEDELCRSILLLEVELA